MFKVNKCLRSHSMFSWKYVNTAEIIGKVTMTRSFINSTNNDFDSAGWLRVIKTPCLFYFRSVKFHYVKETDTWCYVSSLLVLLQYLSTKDNERNLCQNLLTWKHRFGLESARAALCKWATLKLLQTRQTNRNNKKLLKTGFGYG